MLRAGPSPRIRTVREVEPSITKPPINVEVVLTNPRVDTFANVEGSESETSMVPPVPVITKRWESGENATLRSVAELSVNGLSPEKRCVQVMPSGEVMMVP